MELNSNELKALIHLADGKQHNDYPDTLSFAQYCVALKSLYSKGLVYASFIEGGEAECAQIKIEGQAALDDLRDRQGGISIDEEEDDEDEDVYKVLEWLSDGKEHFDYLDIPFFDEICEELETYRLINSGLSKDDGLKITRKGLKYFLELIKQRNNKKTIKHTSVPVKREINKKTPTFSDIISPKYDKEEMLNKIHKYIDYKGGKDVGIVLAKLVELGILLRIPKPSEFEPEFPHTTTSWKAIKDYTDISKQIVRDGVEKMNFAMDF